MKVEYTITEKITDDNGNVTERPVEIEEFLKGDTSFKVDSDTYVILKEARENELSKFIRNAKKRGTSMSFSEMELGILEAGRQDMRYAFADLGNSLEFEQHDCPECGGKTIKSGTGKKKP